MSELRNQRDSILSDTEEGVVLRAWRKKVSLSSNELRLKSPSCAATTAETLHTPDRIAETTTLPCLDVRDSDESTVDLPLTKSIDLLDRFLDMDQGLSSTRCVQCALRDTSDCSSVNSSANENLTEKWDKLFTRAWQGKTMPLYSVVHSDSGVKDVKISESDSSESLIVDMAADRRGQRWVDEDVRRGVANSQRLRREKVAQRARDSMLS